MKFSLEGTTYVHSVVSVQNGGKCRNEVFAGKYYVLVHSAVSVSAEMVVMCCLMSSYVS